jgi:hypothetical protein
VYYLVNLVKYFSFNSSSPNNSITRAAPSIEVLNYFCIYKNSDLPVIVKGQLKTADAGLKRYNFAN